MQAKIVCLIIALVLNIPLFSDELPYPSITDQYAFLVNSYFPSNDGTYSYQYPALFISGNIGSFLVLSQALPGQHKVSQSDEFGSNPNVNYTITYTRMPDKNYQQMTTTDTQAADDKLKGVPLSGQL